MLDQYIRVQNQDQLELDPCQTNTYIRVQNQDQLELDPC